MKLATLALALLLTGCAAAPRSPVPVDAARTFSDASDIETGLTEALEFCAPILSGFESDAYKRGRRAFYLRMSGLLIGSVLVPGLTAANATANASWIAAGAGYGGSASFAASAYESSGLSGTAPAETRNAIVKDLTTSIATVTDGSLDLEVRRAALLRVRSSCVVYSITVPTIPAQ
jgi:hypothetical protein